MVQRLRISLPTQGTPVQSPVWGGPRCCGAATPERCNRARAPRARPLRREKPQ